MNRLSAVVITYNEGRNIERCLKSLCAVADEIVVVDSFSTDDTESICARYNVRFVQRAWDSYSNQKNFGNSLAESDYILSLDADEELSPVLTESILAVKKNWKYDIYYCNRLNFLGGKAFKRCGWYPNKQYRLFDRRKTQWNGRLVHELPEITAKTSLEFLKGDLLHYLCQNTEEYVVRERKYAILRAKELSMQGKSYAAPAIWAMAAFRFFRTYILQLGFLKGKTGLFLSTCNAKMVYLKYSLAKSYMPIRKSTHS